MFLIYLKIECSRKILPGRFRKMELGNQIYPWAISSDESQRQMCLCTCFSSHLGIQPDQVKLQIDPYPDINLPIFSKLMQQVIIKIFKSKISTINCCFRNISKLPVKCNYVYPDVYSRHMNLAFERFGQNHSRKPLRSPPQCLPS